MTTSVQALPVEEIKQKLIDELAVHASMTGKLKSSDVVTCYKEVVCLDMRLSISSLPGALKSPYDLAVANPNTSSIDLDGLTRSILEVRG